MPYQPTRPYRDEADKQRRRLNGKVGALSRSRVADDPELIEARQEQVVFSIAEYARRYAEQAPPLRPDQMDRLSVLLRGVLGGDAA